MIRPVYRYACTIQQVIDGDTFWANVDLGFRIHAFIKIRVRGFDAPELKDTGGQESRTRLRMALSISLNIFVESHGNDGDSSYDRWVCDVDVDGNDLKLLL